VLTPNAVTQKREFMMCISRNFEGNWYCYL